MGDIAGFVLRVDDALDDPVARVTPLQTLCAHHATAFIVRDHLELALEMGADGVHLGSAAGDVVAARAALGKERILGVSCGVSRHAAMEAGEQGADYVAFGDPARRPGPEVDELLGWWSELFVLPCVAEGAITVEDCTRLARAGADMVAVGQDVWTDPAGAAAAVRRFRDALRAA